MTRAVARRKAAGPLLLVIASLLSGGCAAVVATAGAASAATAATVKTAGKVTVATVKATGKVVTSAVTTSGDVTALTIDAAGQLARAGMVVSVDAATGAVYETPWQDGLSLSGLLASQRFAAVVQVANVFRAGRKFEVNLDRMRDRLEDVVLHSGDVVEFRRGR